MKNIFMLLLSGYALTGIAGTVRCPPISEFTCAPADSRGREICTFNATSSYYAEWVNLPGGYQLANAGGSKAGIHFKSAGVTTFNTPSTGSCEYVASDYHSCFSLQGRSLIPDGSTNWKMVPFYQPDGSTLNDKVYTCRNNCTFHTQ